MALIAHQIQGSYESLGSRSTSWTKDVKTKPFVALQVVGRLNRSNLLKRHLCLSIRASPILRPKVKCLRVSAFKGSAQNDESGGRSNGSKAPKNSVKLSYIPHDEEQSITESPDPREVPLCCNSGEDTIAVSPAIQKLFKKWLMMLRTQPPPDEAADVIFDDGHGAPQNEISISEKGNLKQEKGKALMAVWGYFSGLDATIKVPLLIFIPWYLAVNGAYGAEVSKELNPLWVFGPLVVALYVKLLRGVSALYVFTFKQTAKVVTDIPTYCALVYNFVAKGKLKEYFLVRFWQPLLNRKNLDYKEVSREKLKEWKVWAEEKQLDYIESIWPYYSRAIRFLKAAHFI